MTERSAWLLQAKNGPYCVWKDEGQYHVTQDKHGDVLASRDNVNHAFGLATEWNRNGLPAAAKPAPAIAPPVATAPKPGATPMGQRGQGRKRIYDQPTKAVGMRLTPGQIGKLEQLGGVAWVRRMIDKAKVPERVEA